MYVDIIVGEGGRDICCEWCSHNIDKPGTIFKYRDNYYCSEECLMEKLMDDAQDEIEKLWVDTNDNMRQLAEEERGEW